MERRKRLNAIKTIVHDYIDQYAPELCSAPLHMHLLDGPPDAPRFAANAETCHTEGCPYGVPLAQADRCPVRDCPLRCSLRMLIDENGAVVAVQRGSTHWL